MSVLKSRILLVSDMHYTTDLSAAEMSAVCPGAKASAASGNAFGKTQSEKIQKVYSDICREHGESALDAVLVLGDLSVDDYDFRCLPENYCKKFKAECMDRLPCPAYAIPGNHDSYPNEQWCRMFGYERQYTLELGDCVFIMADTFDSGTAQKNNPAAGSANTPIDEDFLREALEKYRGRKIFICAHYIHGASFSEQSRRLIAENDDIMIMYRGHTHISSMTEDSRELGEKTLIDIGGYGYCGKLVNGKYEFNIYDYKWAWGYQILEVYDDKIETYHVKTDMNYIATNGTFVTERRSMSKLSILL